MKNGSMLVLFHCTSRSRSNIKLTSTSRPMLAMWGEDSPTVSSFSICQKHVKGFEPAATSGRTGGGASYLSCKAASQVHSTGTRFGCLEPQHDSGGEFIVSRTAAGLLLHGQE